MLVASRIDKDISLPKPDKQNIKTVKDAIGDNKLFIPIQAGTIDKTHFIHTASALSSINLRRIKLTPKNGGDRTSWAGISALQLDCYQNHNGHTDVYGRMYWDKPSPTITTRFDSLSNGRYGHPDQDRAISLREGATLQSFPLFYKFHTKNKSATAKMIGNAVPPQLACKIAESILNGD